MWKIINTSRIFIMSALSTVLIGCTTIESTSNVYSTISALQFNRVASAYLERETSVDLLKTSDGVAVLNISYAMYGQGRGGVFFVKGNAQQYSAYIDKFLEWAKIAEGRNEELTKEIGRAPTWLPGGSGTLRFTFHSASTQNHVLQISTCTIICIDETVLTLNAINARKLQQLINDFDQGRLRSTDASTYR